jgi:hypothetical protein
MNGSSDTVPDRARAREVTGVFHFRNSLDRAVNALPMAGFDRADIKVVASLNGIRERLGAVYIASEELGDIKHVPRRPFIASGDITHRSDHCRRAWLRSSPGCSLRCCRFARRSVAGGPRRGHRRHCRRRCRPRSRDESVQARRQSSPGPDVSRRRVLAGRCSSSS